jgi:tetratricopeptide (TPR) repeat protein
MLREAEARFAAGDLPAARRLVEQVLRLVPGHPQLLQFLAVICRRAGDPQAAQRAAAAALGAAPNDARIADTLGNALADLGRQEEALAAYRRAATLDPGFADARLHCAEALEALGRLGEARAVLAALPGVEPLVMTGALELAASEPAAAAAAFDRALALDPTHVRAAIGRVKAAVERAEPDAVARLARTRAAHPAERALLLEALDLLAEPETARAVEAHLAADPGWHEGRRALALFRREREGRTDWLQLHEAAVAARPRDPAGWRALVGLHAAVDDFAGAAAAAERAAAALGAPDFLAAAVGHHAAAGALDAAERLLGDPAVAARLPPLTLAKYRLRRRDPAAAEAILAPLCAASGDPETWALRGVAWQALGDRRFDWLNGQDGLVQPLDLRLPDADRDAVTALLRRLHNDAALRIGQSVRGGTQTQGNLFNRIEPELAGLKRAIFAALERYRAALPPADPGHPLLRHRDRAFAMTASWSVRLTGGGFHISHIHPKGVISSASYWALPPADPASPQAGWLELGRPPAYLALDAGAMRTVEPRVGHLVLFPSTLHHGTRLFGDGERITAAFDVAPY